MKKNLYVGLLSICMFMFTGCGSNVLECTKTNSYNERMDMVQTVKVTFKKDSISKVALEMDVDLEEALFESRDSLIESVESEFEQIKDSKGFEFSTSKNDKGFTFKLEADIEKMDDSVIEQFHVVNAKQTYDVTKAEFENDGYTCK